ncbi:MAG: tRNA (N6-isopentenyl adenosine(37)-C2)-methylthiotransferase MiaB [Clostridiales bacterium]|nr:tRNA (N6-isopentenyl adenosine(37)-C2)-methylthiotransferase MiaB [Clostridiales bacterium]
MDKKYLILTYGCQMNVHESEKLAGILEDNGYSVCDNAVDADIVVLNTCAIRENAEQKIFGNIGELKNIKLAKPEMIIAVGGCMSQQKNYASEIVKKFPFVDIVFGTHNLADFERLLKTRIKTGKRIAETTEDETIALRDNLNISRTSGVNAWVNIMYGCNNFCTYCIVPYVRGREVSRPEKDILREVERLLKEGYKQITLLGQNVNSYAGVDENGNKVSFAKLLKDVDGFDGKYRVRFMTSHPRDLSSEAIDVIASSKHICHGIHLPVQSGSNNMLKVMNRHYDISRYNSVVDEIKAKIPDAELTTDIIVGFPGETDQDFEDTISVMKRTEYLQIFGFIYSKRKGTPAEKMVDPVDMKTKKERLNRLLEVKNEIIDRKSAEMLGKTYEVLVESYDAKNDILYGSLDSGKTITFKGNKACVGEFVDVKVTNVKKSVLVGEIVSDTSAFVEKNFKTPIEVSILPKDQKSLKILRDNKKTAKDANDKKSKK